MKQKNQGRTLQAKSKMLFFIFCGILAFSFSLPAKADDVGKNDRKGFFFSTTGAAGPRFNVGTGLLMGGGVRIGAGITDKITLYLEERLASMVWEDNTYFGANIGLFLDSQVKGQYYVWRDLYVNLGLGMAYGFALNSDSGNEFGFSGSTGLGYEFRFGRAFFFSPEVSFEYLRMYGENSFIFQPSLQLGFHF